MTATATVPLLFDRIDTPPSRDPFPDTDVIEDVGYAVGTTSAFLRQAATCAMYEQSVGWATKIAKARAEFFKQARTNFDHAYVTSHAWNDLKWDTSPDSVVWDKEPRKVDLAVALAPKLDVDDEWSAEVFESILLLSQLDFNWNGFGGEPLRNEEAVRAADVLMSLRDKISGEPFIYPSPLGGTVIELGHRNSRITVLLERDLAMISRSGEAPQSFDVAESSAWDQFMRQIEAWLETRQLQSV